MLQIQEDLVKKTLNVALLFNASMENVQMIVYSLRTAQNVNCVRIWSVFPGYVKKILIVLATILNVWTGNVSLDVKCKKIVQKEDYAQEERPEESVS